MDYHIRSKVSHRHPAPSYRCCHRFDPQWGVHSTVLAQNVDFSLTFAFKVHFLHENDHERVQMEFYIRSNVLYYHLAPSCR